MEEKEKAAVGLTAADESNVHIRFHSVGTKVEKKSDMANSFVEKVAADIEKHRRKAIDRKILPLEGLREDVRQIIRHFSETSKSCPNFVAASVLTTIGATAGTALRVVDGGWHNFGQLYTILYGLPSDRKSPAIRPVIAPLEAMEVEYNDEYKAALAVYKEAVKCKEIDPGPPPLCQQLLIQGATPEAIIDVLDKNRRGVLVVADECYNFFRSIDKYSSGSDFCGQLTETWSNSSILINRKGEEIRKVIREPFLAFLGGLQPANLSKIFKKYDGTGFIERWCFCLPNETPAERVEPDYLIYLRWQQLLSDVRDMPPTTLMFTREAKEFLTEYERDVEAEVKRLSDEGDERMASYVMKQNYMIRRYAGIVHVLGETYNLQPTTIPLSEVEYARRLVTFFAEGTKKVYEDLFSGGNELSDAQIVRILEKRHHITERQKQSALADILEKSQQAISKNLRD